MALQLLNVIMILLSSTIFMVGAVAGGRPFTEVVASSSDQLMTAVCSGSGLVCMNNDLLNEQTSDSASLRDASIVTINDLQKDFLLETALVEGGSLSLDENLRDPAPWRKFLTSSAAAKLPAITSSNALDIMRHFGVARDSSMATEVATAAYLCGSAALPGEARSCAATVDGMGAFVAAELGPNVKVYTTTGAPASAPAVKAPVTVVNVAKGSAAEGKNIVVCHHIAFPSMLYYCHHVTGTKVVQATLKPEGNGSAPIKAIAICHMNTTLWLSRHPAFKALNIAKGEEACHFLVENDIVFALAISKMVG